MPEGGDARPKLPRVVRHPTLPDSRPLTPFTDVPFFWSQHYDVPINYVGHAESWDEITINGDIMSKDCVLRFRQKGRVTAVASIFRDLESLQAEVIMERV